MSFHNQDDSSVLQETDFLLLDSAFPAEVYGEFCIWFDHDFDVSEISEILNMSPYDADRQSNMRMNPLTGEQNPGYWEYRTNKVNGYSCDSVIAQLQNVMQSHLSGLRTILNQYMPCGVCARLYTEIAKKGDYPALVLSAEFMRLLAELNADFELVQSNDYE